MRLKISWLGILLLSLLFISGCTKQSAPKSDKIQVVSTLNFYGDVAQKIGGSHVKVTKIIDSPATDPHDFEPTTKTAKMMVNADVIIENGLGVDAWVKKITPHKQNLKVLNMQHIMHQKEGNNPHLWYKLKTMETLANQLARDFGQKDPKHRNEYRKNAKTYIESLAPIQRQINQIKSKNKGQAVAVTEPVYNYTLEELGYRISNPKFALAIENETDPAPKVVEKLQKDLKNHRVSFVVDNRQSSNKVIDEVLNLAKRYHVPIIKVTETMPKDKNYQKWMLSQLNQIKQIKRGKNE